jgi:hypothetical protein
MTDPFSMPGFWMNETTGVLRPAVEAYLNGDPMTGEQIAAMRAKDATDLWIFRQWLAITREAIAQWLDDADDASIDPL